MQPIKSMFNEVQYELIKIILLNVFLTSIIVFLAADLVTLIFGMPLWYAIVIGIACFIAMMALEVRKISIHHVEEKNPELREILRTAKDNQNEDTLMAHALFFEVIEKMKQVSSGTFLDLKKLLIKLGAVFVLSILLVSIAFFNINIQKFENPLQKPIAALQKYMGQITGQEPDISGVEGATEDLYGDANIAKLGQDQLNLEVQSSMSEIDFTQVKEAEPSEGAIENYPGEAKATRCTGDECIKGSLEDASERKTAAEYSQQVGK